MFDQVVFAGGGGRCTWQAGFWKAVSAEMELQPRVVSAVSAGALMSCLIHTQDSEQAMARFCEAFAQNGKNFNLGNLVRRKRVFPHYELYESTMRSLFKDAFRHLRDAPEIRIGVSHPPSWLPPYAALAVGIAAYNVDKHVRKALHPAIARRIGFQASFFRAQDCSSADELVSLILKSSCTPPFTPLLSTAGGRPILDGGIVDNVPVDGIDNRAGSVLVLLTRPYKHLPQIFTRARNAQQLLYIQPSQPVPVRSWDYTRPDLVEKTFALGKADGMHFLKQFDRRPCQGIAA
ncbi:MAG TPA: patatin-like phospholipase family protein [Noviherbaspirillum sp.]|nr:patatin-like phospholipase family protein [Noviherbaspirillum sp.]